MIDRPVFILNAPRSGSSYFFELLSRSSHLWSICGETTPLWNTLFPPEPRDFDFRLTVADARMAGVRERLCDQFEKLSRRPLPNFGRGFKIHLLSCLARQGVNPFYYDVPEKDLFQVFPHIPVPDGPPPGDPQEETLFVVPMPSEYPSAEARERGLRFVDKTPSNCLRVPFLREAFPDALFIFLTRDGRSCVSSLIEAWRHRRAFFLYRPSLELNIRGYSDRFSWGKTHWKACMPPNWRDLVDRPLEEVCAHQWMGPIREVLNHREELIREGRFLELKYEDLVANTIPSLEMVARFIGISMDDRLIRAAREQPVVMATSSPSKDKWRRLHLKEVQSVLPIIKDTMLELGFDPHGD